MSVGARASGLARVRSLLVWPAVLFAALAGGAILLFADGSGPVPADGASLHAERSYADLPLAFERNAGQAPGDFDFVTRSAAASTAISDSGATISLHGKRGSEAIELGLLGASPSEPEALAKLPGEVNYLVGDDQSKWRTGLPTFERVRYEGVYPGIDLLWHGRQDALEYDFRLAPGADPDRIAMRVAGANDLTVAQNGDLVIDAGRGSVRQQAPIAYQERGGERIPVDASYRTDGDTVSFDLGPYDRSRPLVIDPVLAYSTYLGGDATDLAFAISVDDQGAAYVTGETGSTDFNTVGAIEGDSAGTDAFVSKLNPAGSALVYSTYLGGNNNDSALGIAVDSAGAAYVTGETFSTDFNTVGPIEGDSPNGDVFVSKLNSAGSALVYSTYLGGSLSDNANAIAIDSAGAAYVTGETASTDFDTVGRIEGDSGSSDTFVSKLNPQGSALVYSTYLGGGSFEVADGIDVDASGAAYVGGHTNSTDFNTVGAVEGDSSGIDAFVSKLNPQGSALAYSTYLGGSSLDQVIDIAVDDQGAAYVTGGTFSTDFDTVGAIEGPGGGGSFDAIVSKLAPSGGTLVYSTYLGGSLGEHGNAIAVDADGTAYVAGRTASPDFNTVGASQEKEAGDDAFVSKLTPSGASLAYSTPLGGNATDAAMGLAIDSSGAAYVAGFTDSTDFDTVGAIEGDQTDRDAFVTKLVQASDLALSKSDSPDPVREGQELTYTLEVTNLGPEMALDAQVVDTLPAGVDFLSASSGCTEAAGVVTCQLGTIQRSQSKSVQIAVRPTAPGVLTNSATASARGFDADRDNSTAVESTTVTLAPGCLGRSATIVGTSGDDFLEGDDGDDVIVALGGADEISGGGGDDRICTGDGADTAAGGSGADRIWNDGHDFADDDLLGEDGDDRLQAGVGDDLASGGSGDDALAEVQPTYPGTDQPIGSVGSPDEFRGGSGDDEFTVAQNPALVLRGGDGADTLTVTSASTGVSVNLGSGSDELAGPLSGKATGGEDADVVSAHAAADATLQGGPGDDTLNGSDAGDDLRGDGGGDVITGKADVDLIHGGAGPDEVLGGSGAEAGANAIRGGDGNDELRGGSGADEIFGDGGEDNLFGEDDPDILSGGSATDSCNGGAGGDTTDGTCETTVGVP